MTTMRLRVLLPTRVMVDVAVRRVSAEGHQGQFTLLPRHADVLAALVPGLFSWETDGHAETTEHVETFAAVDGGLLIKRGADVLVGTHRAVMGEGLDDLRQTVERDFLVTDERERVARSAMARLEVDFIQRFLALEDRVRG